jgi:XTP/dITP diphosphohydrolase
MKKLIFATNNEHKLDEVKAILKDKYKVLGLKESGLYEDIVEDKDTLEGNARVKAYFIHNKLKTDVFADDTGLEIEALNGEPGVFSARYAGDDCNSQDNVKLVLSKMKEKTNRKARFRTVICLIINDEEYLFEGVVNGEILQKPVGDTGFGYDPIFKPQGYNISFAQMNADEKNAISHRGLAMQQLIKFLQQNKINKDF